MDDVMKVIQEQIEKNPVILYMKDSPQFPQCGFSNTVGRLRGRFEL